MIDISINFDLLLINKCNFKSVLINNKKACEYEVSKIVSRSEFIESVKARNFKRLVQRIKLNSQYNPFEPTANMQFKRIRSNFSMNATHCGNNFSKNSISLTTN